jgi:hypothetical protein
LGSLVLRFDATKGAWVEHVTSMKKVNSDIFVSKTGSGIVVYAQTRSPLRGQS